MRSVRSTSKITYQQQTEILRTTTLLKQNTQKHNIPEYQHSDDKEEAVPLQQVSQVLVVTLRQVWMVVTLLQVQVLQVLHVPLGRLQRYPHFQNRF